MSKHLNSLLIDCEKEGFSVKALENKAKLYIKEKNIDKSNVSSLIEGDTIENLLLVKEIKTSAWAPGGTSYFLLKNCTVSKITSNLQDKDGDIFEYHITFKSGDNLTKFEFNMLLKQLKI